MLYYIWISYALLNILAYYFVKVGISKALEDDSTYVEDNLRVHFGDDWNNVSVIVSRFLRTINTVLLPIAIILSFIVVI